MTDIIIFLIMLLIFCFIAFRSENIGIDTHEYYSYFRSPSGGYYGDQIREVGYNFYQLCFKQIIDNPYIYFTVTTFISLLSIGIIVWKNSPNRGLSLFLFLTLGTTTLYFVLFLAAVRQVLGVGILWLAINRYHQNKYNIDKITIMLLLLSASIHYSILIYVPFVFIDKFNLCKRNIYILLIISLILGMSLYNYFNYFRVLTSFFNYGDYYIQVMLDRNSYSFGQTIPLTLLAMSVVHFSGVLDYFDKLFIWGVILSNIFILLGDTDRISMPLVLFGIISIPKLLYKLPIFYKHSMFLVIVFYYSMKFTTVLELSGSFSNLVPYKSFLF